LTSRPRDPTPSSVQQLIELASLSPEMREAVVHAVSSIHTKESLPFLASLLTSADASERARGVFGLSCSNRRVPAGLLRAAVRSRARRLLAWHV
jgi:hypothetical protein